MFRKFAVCTAACVVVLSNEKVLALQQGSSLTPVTRGGLDDSYTTSDPESLPPLVPSAVDPNKEESSHPSECEPHFPPVKEKEQEKEEKEEEKEEEKVPVVPDATPALGVPSTGTTVPSPDMPAGVPPPPPVVPNPPNTEGPTPKTGPTEEDKTKEEEQKMNADMEQTAQLVKTQSSDRSNGSTITGLAGLIVGGVVAAVAVVGLAVSQVKKARDADAALATPGDHENIHIEIRRTPEGGSTIL